MNDQNNLIHTIYASSSVINFDKDALNKLLHSARRNNAGLNITGMLLYQNDSFFQVLEGETETVEPLFDKISLDSRHNKIIKIIKEPIEKRSFAEWTMGYSKVTRNDLAKIDGLNDFFMQKQPFWEMEADRAHKLLQAFKDGRWRGSLR
jgi:hypothetical protein